MTRDNGVLLGISINPQDRQVEVDRLEQDVQIIQSPTEIDCGGILPEFKLELSNIFSEVSDQ